MKEKLEQEKLRKAKEEQKAIAKQNEADALLKQSTARNDVVGQQQAEDQLKEAQEVQAERQNQLLPVWVLRRVAQNARVFEQSAMRN